MKIFTWMKYQMKLLTVLKIGKEYGIDQLKWFKSQFPNDDIYCITDIQEDIAGIIKIQSIYPWSGWWSKMEMFRPYITFDFLYADIDTVFLNGVPNWNITETTVLADMFGQPHINSGLMFIKNSDKEEIWNNWLKYPEKHMQNYKGDQDFLDVFWRNKQRFQDIVPTKVISYKADILKKSIKAIPYKYKGDINTADVVCFHGQPRPWTLSTPLK